jgi:anaerobic selenocysteine-containing dehydrogenase
MTTAMWSNWVEIHPDTAASLNLHDNDVVQITSPAGSIEAIVYLYPAIRPDTIAIAFGQGHTALGRFAKGRGSNPMKLLDAGLNQAGDLVIGDTQVALSMTGKHHKLARQESIAGVYGKH